MWVWVTWPAGGTGAHFIGVGVVFQSLSEDGMPVPDR